MKALIKIIITVCAIITVNTVFSQISVSADRVGATYKSGELMNFVVVSDTSGVASYEIRYDKHTSVLSGGTIDVVAGESAYIHFRSPIPCFVNCKVTIGDFEDRGAAAFSPYDIKPFEEEPEDFEEYWNANLALLESIPMDPQLTLYESDDDTETYRINLANIGGRRVYGYISVPLAEGQYPAVLVMPSYGDDAGHVFPKSFYAKRGAIFMFLSIHNCEPDEYDPNSYQPDILTNRDSIYYRFAFMAGVRAIDYLFSRDDFDGEHLAVMGTSQGGGLSIVLAGLDDRVKLLIEKVGSLSEHTGFRYDRSSGHPGYLRDASYFGDPEAALPQVKYYDAIYFAKRYEGPCFAVVSWEDQTCPPATTFSAINQIFGTKVIVHALEHGHGSPSEVHELEFDFLRKHFPSMQPYQYGTTGYFAEAGDNVTISLSDTTNLTGVIENNGEVVTDMSVKWEKVSGPGKVSFTNPYDFTTGATFSEIGYYVLRFEGVYEQFPASEPIRLVVSDNVLVEVVE